MIDQRALEAAANAYIESILGVPVAGIGPHRSEVIVKAMRSAIEAYEAVKPRSHDQAGLNAMGKVLDPVAFMDGVHPDASASRQAQARLLASKALKAYQEAASTPQAAEDDK